MIYDSTMDLCTCTGIGFKYCIPLIHLPLATDSMEWQAIIQKQHINKLYNSIGSLLSIKINHCFDGINQYIPRNYSQNPRKILIVSILKLAISVEP